jgi:alpha-N-arabinofuranosidase
LLAGVVVLEAHIRKTIGLINYYTTPGGPNIGIALDEWGVWHPDAGTGARALLQSNTLRDALLAAVVLNSLNQFGSAISMANIAQTFNVLQSMAFTRGPALVLTPTYYAFDLYQPHMEAMGLKVAIDSPTFKAKSPREWFTPGSGDAETTRDELSASASLREREKRVCITMVNQHLTEPLEVEILLAGLDGSAARGGSLRELTSVNVRDENTFEKPRVVGPPVGRQVSYKGNRFVHVIPAHSVHALLLDVA